MQRTSLFRIENIGLFMVALIIAFTLGSEALAREYSIKVDPAIASAGVEATRATTPAEDKPSTPVAVVFVSYKQPFQGDLYVRGFRKDGTEIARSHFVQVNEPADAGGHVNFTFDPQTHLNEVSSFTISGNPKIVHTSTPPREESFGEATKNIVKELFE